MDDVEVVGSEVDQITDVALDETLLLVIGHVDVLRLDGRHDTDTAEINDLSVRIDDGAVLLTLAALDELREARMEQLAVVLETIVLIDVNLEGIRMILCDHDVNAVRLQAYTYAVADIGRPRGTGHDLVLSGLDRNFVVHALEDHGGHDATDGTVLRLRDLDILRTNDGGDVRALRDIIDAHELTTAETGGQLAGHDATEDVTLSDEVGDEGVLRLVVDVLRGTDLLDLALTHDDDLVGHGERLLLVVGDVDEGDAEPIMHGLQLDLHLLTHLEIERAERLVEEEDLRLVDECTCDGDTLLLTAGQGRDTAVFETLEVDEAQHALHLPIDDVLRHLLLTETEGDVVIDVHVRKKRIALEYRIDRTLVWRK